MTSAIGKKINLSILCCLIMIMTVGCWNNRDVTEMSFIVAVGFDRTDTNKIECTVQLVKPSMIGQNSNKSSGKQKAVTVFTTTGETVFEAIRNLLTTVNRKPFWSHLQLIVIGERMAQDGILDIIDSLARDHEIRYQVNMMIAKGMSAKEVMHMESTLEDIPAMHLKEISKNSTSLSKIRELLFIDLLKDMSSVKKEVLIGTFEHEKRGKEKRLIKNNGLEGAAVFKKDRLIGWLTPIETRAFLFTEDKVKGDILNIDNPLEKNKRVSIEIIRSNGKKDIQWKNGALGASIEIKAEGEIGEQQGRGELTTSDRMHRLEEETSASIEKEIQNVVALTQKKYRSDIFGFGNIVYQKYPALWHRMQENWEEVFSTMPIEIKVSIKIKRSGLVSKPFEFR